MVVELRLNQISTHSPVYYMTDTRLYEYVQLYTPSVANK